MAREIFANAPTVVPTSDPVEWEESCAQRSTYWRSEDDLKLEASYAAQPAASSSQLSSVPSTASPARKRRRSTSPPTTNQLVSSPPLPDVLDAFEDAPALRSSPTRALVEALSAEELLPAGRSLRTRTALQQAPFTAEHARYARTLNRNGWEDAVLRMPKVREETEEEMRERKRKQAKKGADDLEGWLVLEDDTRVRREDHEEAVARDTYSQEEITFEPREEYEKDRAPKSTRKKSKPRERHYDDDQDRLREGPSHKRRRSTGDSPPSKKRHRNRSPAVVDIGSSSRSASEPASSPRVARRNRVIDIGSSEDEEDSDDSDRVQSTRAVEAKQLKGKRKKALGAMMPAAFFKRAAKDLELMQQEKLMRDNGSGDDASQDSSDAYDSDGYLRPGHTSKRSGKRRDGEDLLGGLSPRQSSEDERRGSSSEDEAPVADAVTNWLGAFAAKPKKAKKAHKGRDYLDRLLVQSKKKSRNRVKQPEPRKEKQSRLPFAERSNGDAPAQAPRPKKSAPARSRVRFDAESLFEHGPAAIPPISLDAAPAVRSSDSWEEFGRFSPDFGIHALPAGLAFGPDSYIGKGLLARLLHAIGPDGSSEERLAPTLSVFGLTFEANMPPSAFGGQVPYLCDLIFAELETSTSNADAASFVQEACDSLRWVALYSAAQQDATLATEVDVQLTHLRQRITSLPLSPADALRLSWALCEVMLRIRIADKGDSMLEDLMQQLLMRSSAHLVAALGALTEGEMLDPAANEDHLFIETWVCLVHVATVSRQRQAGSDLMPLVWSMLERASAKKAASLQQHPVQAAEALAYNAMMLSMLSAFGVDGIVGPNATLPPHWPVVLSPLSRVGPAAFEDTSRLTNAALQRRDGYVSTLFARSLVFVGRWGWKLDGREGLLPKLFDIINVRQLARLATDGQRDFPAFLQEFDGDVGVDWDRKGDTAFHIFLKLFVHLARHQAGDSEVEKKKAFNKLVTRILPQRRMPFTRDAVSSRVSLDRSILVNHYSLFTVLVIVSPSSANLRLGQIRNLLSFEEADDEARLICLRAIMYLGIVYRHLNLDLQPLLAWLSQICRFLRGKYEALETQRQPAASKTADATAREMYSTALSLSTLLRAVQHILLVDAKLAKAADQRPPYPDLALLDDGWCKELIASPLAQDPLIGSELLKVVECFLTLRDEALSRPEGNVSQDEFGGLATIDYDDPALCEMLGIEPSSQAVKLDGMDASFAQLAHTVLSPGLFRLITAAYSRDTSKRRAAPVVSARSNAAYVDELVNCWVRCAIVVVKAELRGWQAYITWGDEVWKRVSDPLGRREVALRFFVLAAEADGRAFQQNKDEYLSVWCQTIVGKRLSLQHRLTSVMLNLDLDPLLLGGQSTSAALVRSLETGKYDLTLEELEVARLAVLEGIFEQAHRLLVDGGPASRTVLAHLGSMCTAARDNLESFDALEGLAKSSYASFARQVSAKLRSTLGAVTADSLAALSVLNTALEKAESIV